jgi:hypothetical protein
LAPDAADRDMERLCDGLLAALDGGDALRSASAMADLARRLLDHFDREERLRLPELRAADARLLVEEHRYIRARLLALRADAARGALRREHARSFVDELRAHAAHERSIFQRCASELESNGVQAVSDGSVTPSVRTPPPKLPPIE